MYKCMRVYVLKLASLPLLPPSPNIEKLPTHVMFYKSFYKSKSLFGLCLTMSIKIRT